MVSKYHEDSEAEITLKKSFPVSATLNNFLVEANSFARQRRIVSEMSNANVVFNNRPIGKLLHYFQNAHSLLVL